VLYRGTSGKFNQKQSNEILYHAEYPRNSGVDLINSSILKNSFKTQNMKLALEIPKFKKPKTWGGYDTNGAKFYLKTKNGIIIYEDHPDWDKEYFDWINGGNKYFIYGLSG
jgi:hypothetical protein